MGTIGTYNFGRAKLRHNTFIGGVAATINTAELLAAKLAIDVSRISLFEVRGSDIRCRITGDYQLTQSIFKPSAMTYYSDKQGNVKDIAFGSVQDVSSNYLRLYLPGLITPGQSQYFSYYKKFLFYAPNCAYVGYGFTNNMNSTDLKTFVLSKCTQFGSTKGFDNVFNMSNIGKANCKIYAPISEQTSNGGSMDGDLQAVVDAGGTVIFVPNYTKPAEITTLTAGTITATTIQLNFTPPTSLNTIENFEVFIDEIPYQIISGSGQFITNLAPNTTYSKIEVRAIDIYYNRAEESNQITFTTL